MWVLPLFQSKQPIGLELLKVPPEDTVKDRSFWSTEQTTQEEVYRADTQLSEFNLSSFLGEYILLLCLIAFLKNIFRPPTEVVGL